MSRPTEYQLEVNILTSEFIERYGPRHCGGCGRDVNVGEKIVSNIESCCGGCSRHLCADCIKRTYKELSKRRRLFWWRNRSQTAKSNQEVLFEQCDKIVALIQEFETFREEGSTTFRRLIQEFETFREEGSASVRLLIQDAEKERDRLQKGLDEDQADLPEQRTTDEPA